MTTSTIFTQRCRARTPLQSTAADIGRLLWFLLRAPILGVLLALEPLISVVLVVAGALELVAALFFRISGPGGRAKSPIYGHLKIPHP